MDTGNGNDEIPASLSDEIDYFCLRLLLTSDYEYIPLRKYNGWHKDSAPTAPKAVPGGALVSAPKGGEPVLANFIPTSNPEPKFHEESELAFANSMAIFDPEPVSPADGFLKPEEPNPAVPVPPATPVDLIKRPKQPVGKLAMFIDPNQVYFVCNVGECIKQYTTVRALKQHQKVHTEAFFCDFLQCKQSHIDRVTQEDYNQHMSTHAHRFSCRVCGKYSTDSGNAMKKHIKRKHGLEESAAKDAIVGAQARHGVGRLACNLCNYVTDSQRLMKYHQKLSKHSKHSKRG